MTRQFDVEAETREAKSCNLVVKGLKYSLHGALQFQGAELRGFSMRYGDFECLLTLKASFEGKWMVAHVASDTMFNCILKATVGAEGGRLHWFRDKYQPD